VEVLTEGT
jgi:hypothetical protein